MVNIMAICLLDKQINTSRCVATTRTDTCALIVCGDTGIHEGIRYHIISTRHVCGCIYPGISMTTIYIYQFCQPAYIQDIYRCLCQTYVGVHPPTYSQGEYSCIYLLHQNTYIQGFYHWSNGVVGTAYTRITEWSICIYLYPGFVQSDHIYTSKLDSNETHL